ncbi:MAG: LysM peptidoglycan-binding domain-containing protein [Sandaracinaceae bacterium]
MDRRYACIALGAWLLAGPSPLPSRALAQGEEGEMFDYEVQEGDTCGRIARRLYGHSTRYDVIHRHNRDLGPLPHRLRPGTTLRLPRSAGGPVAAATVTAVRRQVNQQAPESGDWSRARVGQELAEGWRVSTEERSSAELTFRSSSVATIREETLVIIYGGEARRMREEGSRAVVRRGALMSRLGTLSGDEPIEVETPSSVATLGAGESSVAVDDDGTTRVAVHRGRAARVRAAGQEQANPVQVAEGQGTRVRRGQRPERPRPLPRAPAWDIASPRHGVGLSGLGGTLRGAWQPVRGALRYRVEVARRADGRDLVAAAEVEASVRELEIHRLPPGTYYVLVSTIDEDLFEGRPSDPVEYTMVGGTLTPPGALEAPAQIEDPLGLDAIDDADLDVDPTAPATARMEVPQFSLLELPGGVRCSLEGADPVRAIRFTSLGTFPLTCVERGAEIDGPTVEVVVTEARIVTDSSRSGDDLVRGRTYPVRVLFDPPLPDVRGLTLTGSEGVTLSAVEPHPDGGLSAIVALDAEAAAEVEVTARTADESALPVARATASTVAPLPGEAYGVPPPWWAKLRSGQETFGLSAFPSWVGLRDEAVRGSGMHVATTILSQAQGDRQPEVRVTAAARAALFRDRLRVDVAVPLVLTGSDREITRTAQVGNRDLLVGASSLILQGRALHLAAGATVWIPTGPGAVNTASGAQNPRNARLVVDVEGSLRLLPEDRLVLRTRQSAVIGVAAEDSRLWASAYGADLWLVGPLSVGVEVDAVVGAERRSLAVASTELGGAVGIAGALGLDLGAVKLALGVRGGAGANDILGPVAGTLTVRGVYPLF